MPLSFPITAAQFFDGLPVSGMRCWFVEPKSYSRLAGGEMLTFSQGATLWKGVVQLQPGRHIDQAAVEAMLGLVSMAGSSFLAYDSRFYGPRNDPTGAILGASTPIITSQASNKREFTLSGLPEGYVISRGDLIGWQYQGRLARHRVVTGRTANGSGVTGQIEVTPHIRTGTANGTAVQLIRPVFTAILSKEVGYGNGRPVITDGSSIEFTQTLEDIS